jgi:hypothetical protein
LERNLTRLCRSSAFIRNGEPPFAKGRVALTNNIPMDSSAADTQLILPALNQVAILGNATVGSSQREAMDSSIKP